MISSDIKNSLEKAITDGNNSALMEILHDSIKKRNKEDGISHEIKDIIKYFSITLKGLNIDGYMGDFPTFIEPVYIIPSVEIGDTVLLGPNVLIDKGCQLGDFCELSNTILFDGVILGKHCKLSWCIVDQDLNLPPKFEARNSYITKNTSGEIELHSI